MTWRLILFALSVGLAVGAAVGLAVYVALLEVWDTEGDE